MWVDHRWTYKVAKKHDTNKSRPKGGAWQRHTCTQPCTLEWSTRIGWWPVLCLPTSDRVCTVDAWTMCLCVALHCIARMHQPQDPFKLCNFKCEARLFCVWSGLVTPNMLLGLPTAHWLTGYSFFLGTATASLVRT